MKKPKDNELMGVVKKLVEDEEWQDEEVEGVLVMVKGVGKVVVPYGVLEDAKDYAFNNSQPYFIGIPLLDDRWSMVEEEYFNDKERASLHFSIRITAKGIDDPNVTELRGE